MGNSAVYRIRTGDDVREEPEQAHDLAAAAGGRVLGGPARGW